MSTICKYVIILISTVLAIFSSGKAGADPREALRRIWSNHVQMRGEEFVSAGILQEWNQGNPAYMEGLEFSKVMTISRQLRNSQLLIQNGRHEAMEIVRQLIGRRGWMVNPKGVELVIGDFLNLARTTSVDLISDLSADLSKELATAAGESNTAWREWRSDAAPRSFNSSGAVSAREEYARNSEALGSWRKKLEAFQRSFQNQEAGSPSAVEAIRRSGNFTNFAFRTGGVGFLHDVVGKDMAGRAPELFDIYAQVVADPEMANLDSSLQVHRSVEEWYSKGGRYPSEPNHPKGVKGGEYARVVEILGRTIELAGRIKP